MRSTSSGGPPTALLWLATLLVIAGSVAGYIAYRKLWTNLRIADVTLGELVAIGPLLLLALVLMLLVASWRSKARLESDRAAVAEARIDSLTSNQSDLVLFEADDEGVLTYISESCRSLLGLDPAEMVGRSLGEFMVDDLQPILPSEPEAALSREGGWAHADGKPRTLEVVVQRGATGDAVTFRGAARDVGARVAVENTLRETHQSFLDMLESAQNGILIVAGSGKILLFNRTICDILGWEPEQLRRTTLNGLPLDGASGSLMSLVTARMWGAAPAGRYQKQLTRPDGEVRDVELSISTYPLGDAERSGWIEVSDVTEQTRQTEQIQQLADFDHLTGLPNRQLMERSIAEVLEEARAARGSFAVMLMDLDRFKLINDTLGHASGDQLLQEVAARFVDALPAEDMVARFGGDEFLVLLPSVERLESAMQAAGSLVNSLATPLEVGGRMLHTATSIGVALYPQDGEDAATLIRRADSAMYRAKELGGSGYQFASASVDADSHHRLNIENDLRQAIEAGELTVYYHPEVDIQTGRIVSFEALVRWDHPEHGLLPPLDFIPILEDNGLIRLVDEWVLREACMQNERWRADGLGPVIVSVNLSARVFSNEDMLDTLRSVIIETGIEPELLELEVTETAALNNVEEAVAILHQIRELGVRTALDDFGTGHSSLVRLKEFPLSTLKIDGSFVQNVTTDEDSGAIVSGVIALGHALGLTVVAEGVEQKRQFTLLRHLGCDLAQGYLFARPLTAEDATALLSEHRRLGQGFAA